MDEGCQEASGSCLACNWPSQHSAMKLRCIGRLLQQLVLLLGVPLCGTSFLYTLSGHALQRLFTPRPGLCWICLAEEEMSALTRTSNGIEAASG